MRIVVQRFCISAPPSAVSRGSVTGEPCGVVRRRVPRTAAAVVAVVLVSGSVVGFASSAGASPSWSTMPTPGLGGSGGVLNGVSCPSATSCFAVGSRARCERRSQAAGRALGRDDLVDHAHARPAGITYSLLKGVSCPSATFCFAVGEQTSNRVSDRSLIEEWNGQTWSPSASAAPYVELPIGRRVVCEPVDLFRSWWTRTRPTDPCCSIGTASTGRSWPNRIRPLGLGGGVVPEYDELLRRRLAARSSRHLDCVGGALGREQLVGDAEWRSGRRLLHESDGSVVSEPE